MTSCKKLYHYCLTAVLSVLHKVFCPLEEILYASLLYPVLDYVLSDDIQYCLDEDIFSGNYIRI